MVIADNENGVPISSIILKESWCCAVPKIPTNPKALANVAVELASFEHPVVGLHGTFISTSKQNKQTKEVIYHLNYDTTSQRFHNMK